MKKNQKFCITLGQPYQNQQILPILAISSQIKWCYKGNLSQRLETNSYPKVMHKSYNRQNSLCFHLYSYKYLKILVKMKELFPKIPKNGNFSHIFYLGMMWNIHPWFEAFPLIFSGFWWYVEINIYLVNLSFKIMKIHAQMRAHNS